jgi:hypothetical protein
VKNGSPALITSALAHLRRLRKRRFDFNIIAGIEDLQVQPKRGRCCLHLICRHLGHGRISRINQKYHYTRGGHDLVQQFEPLR